MRTERWLVRFVRIALQTTNAPWIQMVLREMNRFQSSQILSTLALVLVAFLVANAYRVASAQQASVQSMKVGSLIVDNKPAGSCFFVDPRGYIATSFWNVREADEAAVLFGNGGRFRILGVIAASKGKDIAILKISALTKGLSLGKEALDLDSDADPKIDENAFPWGGPNSVPAISSLTVPKIKRRLLGAEYLMGLPKAPLSDIGCDPDTRWIWLSFYRHLSCNGGPVFDRQGQVLGMLSASLDPSSKAIADPKAIVYSAVHIAHVKNLIPADDVKPKSLASLKNWVDPLPSIDTIKPIHNPDRDEENSLASPFCRDRSISERMLDLQQRIIQVEQENAEAGKRTVQLQSDNLELLAKIEKAETELKTIRPEESYRETYEDTEYRTETTTKQERGADGKTRSVETTKRVPRKVTKTRTEYRFSSRQRAAMDLLRKEITELQTYAQNNRNEFAFDTNIRIPFVTQIRRQFEQEFFYFADPLGLRNKEEQHNLEVELTKTIEEGGAEGGIYLARAMSRIAQGDWDGAEIDLKEADEVDTKFRPLTQGLTARIHLLKGDKTSGGKAMKELMTEFESDARIWVLAARIDIDSKNYGAAVRHLEQAAKLAPNQIEIKLGLAWTLLSAPTVNTKRTTDTAIDAVRLTAGRDWSALAALAAAYSHSQKSELAIKMMEAATQMAPVSALETCEKWRAKLNSQQTIAFEW